MVSYHGSDDAVRLLFSIMGTRCEFTASSLLHLLMFGSGLDVSRDLLSPNQSSIKMYQCHVLIELSHCGGM